MLTQPAKFATALNCIDGRVQQPVTAWVKEHYQVDYVDTITEPGIDKVLSDGDPKFLEELKRFVEVSVKAHGSKVVVVAGHHGCAGDPVNPEMHYRQIKKAVDIVESWGFDVKIVGLFVNKNYLTEVVCGN